MRGPFGASSSAEARISLGHATGQQNSQCAGDELDHVLVPLAAIVRIAKYSARATNFDNV
jgi:hypothetical protein